jgi:hypothetical protein
MDDEMRARLQQAIEDVTNDSLVGGSSHRSPWWVRWWGPRWLKRLLLHLGF